MPTVLKFPIIHPIPELALENLLLRKSIQNFGHFGYWPGYVKLGHKGQWMRKKISAKIDTGASISLLPMRYKKELNLEEGIPYTLYGVVRTEECKVDVELHKVDVELSDSDDNKLVFNESWLALTPLERTPLLIGYKDILQRCKISTIDHSETLILEKREIHS